MQRDLFQGTNQTAVRGTQQPDVPRHIDNSESTMPGSSSLILYLCNDNNDFYACSINQARGATNASHDSTITIGRSIERHRGNVDSCLLVYLLILNAGYCKRISSRELARL